MSNKWRKCSKHYLIERGQERMVMINGWLAGKIDKGEGDEENNDLGYTHRMTDREEEEERKRVFTD